MSDVQSLATTAHECRDFRFRRISHLCHLLLHRAAHLSYETLLGWPCGIHVLGLAARDSLGGDHLASGDRRAAVTEAAAELGIDNASAELRPEDKLATLQRLQSEGRRVLMIGDGMNDGPVLAAADVSMAMGRGSSIAHAAGDLLLLRESLASLPRARDVAVRTLVIVRQNLRWAVIYNMTALPLAAIGLMPPWVAALGMSLSSLLVVFNARRILRASQPTSGAA